MKTPEFWQSKNVKSTALLPLSWLYALGVMLHRARARPESVGIPVLCIGNATAGGAGKTPVALHIGKRLREAGVKAYFLSRGYGGNNMHPVLVDTARHSVREVGDEPLLLARILPTVVARSRIDGARFAVQQGAEVIIMDDGFQNPSLKKTFSILVIDGKSGFGNGRLLPAGPLRETPKSAFAHAQAVVVVNPAGAEFSLPPDKKIYTVHTQLRDAGVPPGTNVVAFCGIAQPQKFFDMLQRQGAQLVATVPFPDHHRFRPAELRRLAARAEKRGALLITTAKDAVRLPEDFKKHVTVVELEFTVDDPATFDAMIDYAVHHADV